MKRILIAFDDSPGADAAMRDMVRAGLPERCEAKVLTIADVWLPLDPAHAEPSFAPRPAGAGAEARQHALQALAEAREISARGVERLRGLFPGWEIHVGAAADSPAWGIIGEARRWPAELVVIGSHGRSRLEKFFLGSVSYKVAAEAACSVRVFKAHHRANDHSVRVLLALHGSADAEYALQQALARRWPTDTKFQLVSVIDEKLRAAASSPSLFPTTRENQPDESLADMLQNRADLFAKRRFEVSTHILSGDPKSAILHHAASWEADCIFLGARGLQHGDRLYLGTLAAAVLTRAHCTVEIARPVHR